MLTRPKNPPTKHPKQRLLQVLAVGDVDHAEFVEARRALESGATTTCERNASAVEDLSQPFDLIVIFQSRPGSFPADWVHDARERMPLAGFAVLLGSWCEGEQRTGAPLPFCERVFWYQFTPWWRAIDNSWRAGRPTSWQDARGERASTAGQVTAQGLITIDAPDVDTAEALVTACEAIGYSACWSPAWRARPMTSPPAAGIWVGGQVDAREEERLARFRESLPESAPLVALLDFPRRDRVARALALGATAVLGKPWRLEQLAACVTTHREDANVGQPTLASSPGE